MAKQRVYELARDLGLESKDVLERARELDIEVKTASSGLDEDAVALVRLSYEEAGDGTPEPEAVPADSTAAVPDESVEEPEIPADEPEPESMPGEPEADPADHRRVIEVTKGITVGEFAELIRRSVGPVVRELIGMGEMAGAAAQVPDHALKPLATAFGYDIVISEAEEVEVPDEEPQRFLVEYEDDPASLVGRAPVVTVMGHVDHGKTKLLDSVRKANVVAGEAGGITQHIGAYQVERKGGKTTFIDTPGHEAFTSLRARGARVTDVVILVVAADDGVMPQTVEAINHAKAAGVPIIVAINKMDLPGANPANVRAQLTEHGIVVEELGGDVVSAEISALQGQGVDELLDLVQLIAEVEELTANPSAPASGTVIENRVEKGRGPVGSVIVQRGTLRSGDAIVAGPVSGRVRAMFDETGQQVKEAGPSTPVLIMGWDELPTAGDMFEAVKDERTARGIAAARVTELRDKKYFVPTAQERLAQLVEHLRSAEQSELNIVVKADAHGSLEAIRDAVVKITREDARVNVIHGAVGGINENDILLAEVSDAIVYGFNTRPDAGARNAAKDRGIEIRTFRIIYELLDDIEAVLVGQLEPDEVEAILGVAEVRATFRAPRYGMVAGCYVTEGDMARNARARLVRDGVVVYDGRIGSLRRFKEDVRTVASGFECGIGLENFKDVKDGDLIEAYEVREVART